MPRTAPLANPTRVSLDQLVWTDGQWSDTGSCESPQRSLLRVSDGLPFPQIGGHRDRTTERSIASVLIVEPRTVERSTIASDSRSARQPPEIVLRCKCLTGSPGYGSTDAALRPMWAMALAGHLDPEPR